MSQSSPLEAFIKRRMVDLHLTRGQLARRIGTNANKVLRQLDSLIQSQNPRNVEFINRLANAIEVPNESVMTLVEAQHRNNTEMAEAAYRAQFKPHGIWKTQLDRPSSISMAAWINAPARLLIPFPPELQPSEYIGYCQETAPKGVPLYGFVTGFTVNYTPDHAVEFNLEGMALRTLDNAPRVPIAGLCL